MTYADPMKVYSAIIAAVLLAACSRYPDYSDQPPAVEPVEIVREVPGYDFFWPMSIAADSGLVFIADFRDCNIKVFDHQLTLLDSIGRQGEGPGEFKAIIDISARQGMLAALNIYPSRISIFDYRGNLLHDFPVEANELGGDRGNRSEHDLLGPLSAEFALLRDRIECRG